MSDPVFYLSLLAFGVGVPKLDQLVGYFLKNFSGVYHLEKCLNFWWDRWRGVVFGSAY